MSRYEDPKPASSCIWQFWIDRGGTFTDVIARSVDGELRVEKLLSENPGRYDDAALEGVRRVLGLAPNEVIPPERIQAVKMGTTVATNALLERRGAPTVLVTTEGLGDALRIGTQARPDLFALHIRLPELLHARVIEVPGRITADGKVLKPLDAETARDGLAAAYADGIRACAIVFMHAWRYPDHEREIARIAREIGFTQVSMSHEVSPLMRFVARGHTTVADAYLSPVLRRYVDRVQAKLGGARLMFMQSSGGLTEADRFQGRDAILSGPAGGIVGAVKTAEGAGLARIVTFDMGGTSTDVAHYDGEYERAFETEVAGVRMRVPMMRIHTVAAGGGSILKFENGRFQVGPESAGADPGPACYRKGGPLTVTDANLVLGRIQPRFFPAVFGRAADQPLDEAAVRTAFAEMSAGIAAETGREITVEKTAEGFLRIAVENMAAAIKKISIARGHDVTRYALVSFGGAGGQHACRVADALGIREVFIHPLAGVLSALGMGLADVIELKEAAIEKPFSEGTVAGLERPFAELEEAARKALADQDIAAADMAVECRVRLRYGGTDTPLEVPAGDSVAMVRAFEDAHLVRFGFVMAETPLVVEAIVVEAVGASGAGGDPAHAPEGIGIEPEPVEHVRMVVDGVAREVPVHTCDALCAGAEITGPAMVIEDGATTVIESGWRAYATVKGHLHLKRVAPARARLDSGGNAAADSAPDPVMLELFNNLFMSIADEMGVALASTAQSVNIKERFDFSCALFDGDGGLIANAPHIPVHLGSMSQAVRAVAARHAGDMHSGDVFIHNAPYDGGTHLPDITVIRPVFAEEVGAGTDGAPLFFVAARGHHADIGGTHPGSMPPASHEIGEEGVVFSGERLVVEGRILEDDIRRRLASGPWPARNPDQNVADLKAQVAACARGVAELQRMVGTFGCETVDAYMSFVQDNAEEAVRCVIDGLADGAMTVPTDEGGRIAVAVRVDRAARSVTVDFSGTSGPSPANFNAPEAVVQAAVLYAFRTMVTESIPLNEGCLRPISIVVPKGSLLSPVSPAAVVAGNVETSQIIVDAILGATGCLAASQGTMNNVTFGDARHQYYETLCGGTGAGPDFPGTSAVHSHMTNSRLTDPEVLEWRYPVLLENFSVRTGSGGNGRFQGGDGVIRRIRFREAMTAAILSGRRSTRPLGLDGGGDGKSGRNAVERNNGRIEEIGATAEISMEKGDVLVIETPGGGGYGQS